MRSSNSARVLAYKYRTGWPCTKCGGPRTKRDIGRCGGCHDHWQLEPLNAARAAMASTRRELLGNARRVDFSSALRAAILERDSWTCQLCYEPIDPTARHPHPMHAQIDHIEPWCVSHNDSASNLQAAHALCNNRKNGPTL